MSSEQEQIRQLAERVARKLSGGAEGRGEAAAGGGATDGDRGDELSALRAGLDEMQRRLAHVESHIRHDEACAQAGDAGAAARERGGAPPPSRAPWLSGTYVPAAEAAASHPSQERFNDIGEAVSELVDYFEREKTCNVEPGGKPCDHCAMCSSRGF